MNSNLVFYGGLLTEIKDRICQARTRAALSANTEMIMMYWDIGQKSPSPGDFSPPDKISGGESFENLPFLSFRA